MSSVMHHIAVAALPVALGLLAAQMAAGILLAADESSARVRRIAREHLRPLGIWCLGAVALYGIGLLAAGDLHAGSVALIAGVAALGIGLCFLPEPGVEEARPAPTEPDPDPEPAVAAAAADPVRPTDGSLWLGPVKGGAAASDGLWR